MQFLLLLQKQRDTMLPVVTCLQKQTLIVYEIERNSTGLQRHMNVMYICVGWREASLES